MSQPLRRLACLAMVISSAPIIACDAVLAQAERWTEAMAAFERQDLERAPVAGGIVFVGSSTVKNWDVPRDFPDVPVVNRGFGGSQIVDAIAHADLLVIRHRPRTVVFYAGDNDLAAGKPPRQVAADFRIFVAKVHAALPATRIVFIGIKPSIQRWALIANIRETNALIRAYCERDDRLGYVDVDGAMLGWDEAPRMELFAEDGLHLSRKGYELWAILLRPFIEPHAASAR